MPPLKAIEQAEFGGVDSRSNPVVMPQNRFLQLRNWLPRPDGHLELREGYTLQTVGAGFSGSGAIHSISPYTAAYPGLVTQSDTALPFTNGAECIFFWIGTTPYVRRLDGATNPTQSPTVKGNPIASSNRWQYALGKNGYLFMHNGTDLKFFDGLYLRDIGLPVITQSQANKVSVAEGLSAPTNVEVDGVNFDFTAATGATQPPYVGPSSLANVVSSYMYMAYFDKNGDVLAPSSEPLSGNLFPDGSTAPGGPTVDYLRVNNLPPPQDSGGNPVPGAVTLLYYPNQAVPILLPGTKCYFYPHDSSWNGRFEYRNPSDMTGSGWPTLPTATSTFDLADNQGLLFNPGDGQTFPGWTGNTTGATSPMVVAGVTAKGRWDNSTAVISGSATEQWVMAVEGQLSIPGPGEYTFIFVHDDGALIGFGGGVTFVSGDLESGVQTMTADKGYPLMSCRNDSTTGSAWKDTFVANFPAAGTYPFEIDYCNGINEQTCCLYNGDGSVIVPSSAPREGSPAVAPSFLTQDQGLDSCSLAMTTPTVVTVTTPTHTYLTGDVIVLSLHKDPSKTDYTSPMPPSSVEWSSSGPFTITVVDTTHFTFNVPDASLYDGATPITIYNLVQVTTASYIINTQANGWPYTSQNDRDTNQDGTTLLPGPLDTTVGGNLIPASAIGGSQPGYQFYASIYNPYTGHVGNRVAIGARIANSTPCIFNIGGLPDLSVPFSGKQLLCWGNGTETTGGLPQFPKPDQGDLLGAETSPGDSEWCLLIGRTGDGGEVPYAVIDSNGNWVYAQAGAATITIDYANIDGNSELPTQNYIPPAFSCFWREGDRICGSIVKQAFVFNSGSELDDTTGIFVGDPAQSWSPIQVETFPSAQAVWGGFGYMQESWVFTKGQVAQLSELSGERAWNGPYNFGVIGPYAFDGGWNHLPFWVSRQKQLCTMLPNANGPMAISTEYDAALLQRIGPDPYASKTEVIYYRDPLRLIEVLRIKCLDANGNPFVIVHDFNLRDDSAPYGQAYEEDFEADLSSDFTTARVRADDGFEYMWAGTHAARFAQFYDGGDDNGTDFTADAICLRYLGGDRTALKTIEWYGDEEIVWYVTDKMLGVTNDNTQWVKVTDQMRPFPGDVESGHYMADLQRPEMIHTYLWIQLVSHAEDAPIPTNPMALNTPPHLPLETYGRLYLSAPILGDTRGR